MCFFSFLYVSDDEDDSGPVCVIIQWSIAQRDLTRHIRLHCSALGQRRETLRHKSLNKIRSIILIVEILDKHRIKYSLRPNVIRVRINQSVRVSCERDKLRCLDEHWWLFSRLEDLRKKSSLDFHTAPVRDAAKKREEEGSEDESSDSDTDTESSIRAVTATTSTAATTTTTSPMTRAKWFSQAGLRVGFSSIPDQIYRKSLRKGGIIVQTFLPI